MVLLVHMFIWVIWIALNIITLFLILGAGISHQITPLRRSLSLTASFLAALGVIALIFAPTFVWHAALLAYMQLFLLFLCICSFRDMTPKSIYTNSIGIIAALSFGFFLYFFPQTSLLWSLLILASAVTAIAAFELRVALRRYRLKKYNYTKMPLEDLPTVSVCVPARNETYSLVGCLDSILDSDYPKLEIIVLDDCSQDSTSQLIKSFAHAGVRFVQGVPPKEGWLGRNQACDVLARESSGSFLLYVDIDTRIEPSTISRLIDYALLKRLTMVSVLPERKERFGLSSLLSPLRYFWQMIIPQFIHTPAATALWLVRRRKLLEIGGFEPVKGHIMPENALARTFDLHGTYRYLIGGSSLGAYYAKKWKSLIETSMRISYPSLMRTPFAVLLASLSLYLFMIVPYFVLIDFAFSLQWNSFTSVAAGLAFTHILLFALYAHHAGYRSWLFTALLLPITTLQEIAIIIASMIGYEFNQISWKGRNICYPVLNHGRKK